jgi:hypothetical protein
MLVERSRIRDSRIVRIKLQKVKASKRERDAISTARNYFPSAIQSANRVYLASTNPKNRGKASTHPRRELKLSAGGGDSSKLDRQLIGRPGVS